MKILLAILLCTSINCSANVQHSPILVATACPGHHLGRKDFTSLDWSQMSDQNKIYYTCYFDVYIDSALFSKSDAPVDIKLLKQKKEEEELKKLLDQYNNSLKNARYVCKTQLECSKAFALTQIFISENSDMKIQVSTDTIIETYNPTDDLKVGFKALKMPGKGYSATIKLNAYCKDNVACMELITTILNLYPLYIKSNLQ